MIHYVVITRGKQGYTKLMLIQKRGVSIPTRCYRFEILCWVSCKIIEGANEQKQVEIQTQVA